MGETLSVDTRRNFGLGVKEETIREVRTSPNGGEGPRSSPVSLDTLGHKGPALATVPTSPPLPEQLHTAWPRGRPGLPRQDGTGHRRHVSCLGTINPLTSRGWVGWQPLHAGVRGLCLPGLSVGAPGSWERHHPRPPAGQDQRELRDTHWVPWQVAHTRCIFLLPSPRVPGRSGTRWPFRRWGN